MDLPDFAKALDYENLFYQSCDPSRVGKLIAHHELFQKAAAVPGDIVECGVFKGNSFARFAMFRALHKQAQEKKIIGFDVFGRFPDTAFQPDQAHRDRFVSEAGELSATEEQIMTLLRHKKCDHNIELVKGDICQTVPAYAQKHPSLKISLLHIDSDLYEPAVAILNHLYPKLSPGGVLILDDYGQFAGETKAVDDYFAGQQVTIERFSFSPTPAYMIKRGL